MRTKIKTKTKFIPQPILFEQVIEALIEKLGPSKASEFWSSLGYGKNDYTKIRKKIFDKETVTSLYKKIKAAQ